MLRYEIEGGHLPVVICYPEPGQTLCTERGSMSWMSPNMDMQTKRAVSRIVKPLPFATCPICNPINLKTKSCL